MCVCFRVIPFSLAFYLLLFSLIETIRHWACIKQEYPTKVVLMLVLSNFTIGGRGSVYVCCANVTT